MLYEIVKFSFEAALEKTSVTDLMEMVWKTVPCSRSRMREAALSELGSAPRLDVNSCIGGSETRSTAGTRDSLNAICMRIKPKNLMTKCLLYFTCNLRQYYNSEFHKPNAVATRLRCSKKYYRIASAAANNTLKSVKILNKVIANFRYSILLRQGICVVALLAEGLI